MSAREIRRAFAAPFVVTLAGAAALAACTKKPAEMPHHNPPGPEGPGQPHANPPAPDKNPKNDPAPAPDPTPTSPKTADSGAPDPIDTKVREPAKYESRWTVSKYKGQPDCQAFHDVSCPKAEPGKPVPTCNPPPPIKYACPDGFKEGDSLKIVLRVGATDCFVDRGEMRCPDGAKCNPPPPRKIACPSR